MYCNAIMTGNNNELKELTGGADKKEIPELSDSRIATLETLENHGISEKNLRKKASRIEIENYINLL